MSRPGWFPPDGAVAIQAGPAISCAACGTVENAATPRNALRMRERHRCPAGTPKAVPRCPVCDSTETVCPFVVRTPWCVYAHYTHNVAHARNFCLLPNRDLFRVAPMATAV